MLGRWYAAAVAPNQDPSPAVLSSKEALRTYTPVMVLLWALLVLCLHECLGHFYGSAPPDAAAFKVDLKKLYQKTGLSPDQAGRSCAELLTMGGSL